MCCPNELQSNNSSGKAIIRSGGQLTILLGSAELHMSKAGEYYQFKGIKDTVLNLGLNDLYQLMDSVDPKSQIANQEGVTLTNIPLGKYDCSPANNFNIKEYIPCTETTTVSAWPDTICNMNMIAKTLRFNPAQQIKIEPQGIRDVAMFIKSNLDSLYDLTRHSFGTNQYLEEVSYCLGIRETMIQLGLASIFDNLCKTSGIILD